MNNKLILRIFLLGVLLISCSWLNTDHSLIPPADTSTTEAIAPLNSRTPTFSSTSPVIDNCVNVTDVNIDGSTPPINLILTIDRIPYIYNVNSGSRDPSIQMHDKSIVTIDTLDSKLAYTYHDDNLSQDMLLIMDLSTHETQKIPIDYDKWNSVDYWANPESLVLVKAGSMRNPLIIYNTQDHTFTQVSTDYPDIPEDPNTWRFWPALGVINSGLNKLVYISTDTRIIQDPTTNQDEYLHSNSLIVQDLTTNSRLFEIPDVGDILAKPPVWSPDGNRFAFLKLIRMASENIYLENLYIASTDGKIINLTNMDQSIGYSMVSIDLYKWSTSGNKIAFWIKTTKGGTTYQGHRLAVADIPTKKITTYCITSSETYSGRPVWSEDEKYLAVTLDNPDVSTSSLIVNIENNTSIHLPQNSIVYGWVTNPK
jgi:hypothetical protein